MNLAHVSTLLKSNFPNKKAKTLIGKNLKAAGFRNLEMVLLSIAF